MSASSSRKSNRISTKKEQEAQEASSSTLGNQQSLKSGLTADEEKSLKNLLMAFMIHRKEHGSPTDYQQWNVIKKYLAPIFKLAKEAITEGKDISTIPLTKQTEDAKIAENKWREFFIGQLIKNNEEWPVISNRVQEVYRTLKYVNTEQLHNVVPEGNIRNTVLHTISFEDYKKMINKTAKKMTREQKLDAIYQFNDPTSEMSLELRSTWPEKGEFEKIKEVVENLNVDGIMINVNLIHDNKYLLKSIVMFIYNALINPTPQVVLINRGMAYFEAFLDNYNFDLTIIERIDNVKSNIISILFALYIKTTTVRPRNVIWKMITIILKKRPLREFYVGTSKKHTKSYGITFTKISIDNVSLMRYMDSARFTWLVEEGGMDITEGYGGRTVFESSDYVKEDLENQKRDIEKTIADATTLIENLQAQIRDLQETINTVQQTTTEKQSLLLGVNTFYNRFIQNKNYLQGKNV
jgi:hypothetical protein